MASRVSRRFGRYAFYTAGAVSVGAAVVLLPPKESLPPLLLSSRVLLEGVGRVGRCAVVSGQIVLDYHWSLRATDSQARWDEVHERCAHRLVRLAEANGGLYVKAGQIFANMTHILPAQYCQVMNVLQDRVTPRPFSEVVAVLERDLRQPVAEVLSYIDPQPLAAASLAQVHRGTLRKEAVDVAVKVQYIDIAQRFTGDMRTINLMLRVAGWLFPGFDLGDIVDKLNDTVAAELDFRLEASNSIRAGQDLLRGGFGNNVVSVRMFPAYITPRVLVSELVQNPIKITNRREMERQGISVRHVADWFFSAISYQIFTTGFFHGDPHAGNVLVHRLPSGAPQVVLLDYGLCGVLTHAQRREVSDIWTASVTHDSARLSELARRFGCDDYALFASCFLQHPYEYFDVKGQQLLSQRTVEAMRYTIKHKMTAVNKVVAALPKEYALILRSIMATKAINRDLGNVVNRSLCMLRYSVRTSYEDLPFFGLYYYLFKAWLMELYSSVVLAVTQFFYPELAKLLDDPAMANG